MTAIATTLPAKDATEAVVGEGPAAVTVERTGVGARAPDPTFTTMVRRREDQLMLRFDFYGIDLSEGRPQLIAVEPRADLVAVVTFMPQHIGEQAYYALSSTANDETLDPPVQNPESPPVGDQLPPLPVGSRIAGGSRLAFVIPRELLPMDYTLEKLLDWSPWVPAVAATARGSLAVDPVRAGAAAPETVAPTALQTAIELPWWLLLSPSRLAGWVHSDEAVTVDGRTELWHTRFAGRASGGELNEHDAARKTVRAVWARDPGLQTYLNGLDPDPVDGEDFSSNTLGMPFRTAVSPRDRFDLVSRTAYYAPNQIGDGFNVPPPINVDTLTLTPRGATIDASGAWLSNPQTLPELVQNNLQSWRHVASGGRDQYVKVVRSGFLCGLPFGASLFKVTERTFRTTGTGQRGDPKRRVAYTTQQYYIGLREREIILDGTLQQAKGNNFPFVKVRAKTMVTPTIKPPAQVPNLVGIPETDAFVVRKGDGTPFLFEVVVTDRAGRTQDLAFPALFVNSEIATDLSAGGDMKVLRDWYNTRGVNSEFRAVDMRGQLVAPAEPSAAGGTDTDVEMHRLTLGLEAPKAGITPAQLRKAGRPGYFPTMAEAEVRLAAAEAVLGEGMSADLPVMVLDPTWVANGFDKPATQGAVFLRLKDWQNPTNSRLNFSNAGRGDRAGGVAAPDVAITALSRRSGIVGGDPSTFQQGEFNAAAFFGGLKANLLGDVALTQVVDNAPAASDQVLALQRRETADEFVTELSWTPALKNAGPFRKNNQTTLVIGAVMTAPKSDPTAVTTVMSGELRNFDIVLLEGADFLTVSFNRLAFRSSTGAKTDVDVEIREVLFAGALEFVNELRKYLGYDSGGFSIELQPTHLDAGLELPIPSVPLGVFSLQNLTFNAGMTIPFTGKPVRFRFGFNTVDNPFLVSVMIFGGGGSFELAVGTDGVESFQASLEFGVVAALDFGVASGSVSVTAGIYIAIGVENPPTNPQGAAELTGFLKIKGEVEVLGLISLGIFMKAAFTYIPDLKKAIVKATIIVEVEVWPFSGEVEIEYEKRFGGLDPGFGASVPESQWHDYVGAFAPIGG